MSNNMNEIQEQQSVIAIAKTDDKLKAVELQVQNGSVKVLWSRTATDDTLNWQAFAKECGLSVDSAGQFQIGDNKTLVLGHESSGTAFYNINMPTVEEKEMASMVQMQAESRLPLPADQMELAWRSRKIQNNQLTVTIAGARKLHLQQFLDKVRNLQPEKVLLDCDAIVEIWKKIYSGSNQKAVLVNAGPHKIQVCSIEDGRLVNAVTMDVGIKDFAQEQPQPEGDTIDMLIQEGKSEAIDMFIHDMESVLGMFGSTESAKLPVLVLSDGGETYQELVSNLNQAGIEAQLVQPEPGKISAQQGEFSPKDVFSYRIPIGLGLIALNDEVQGFDLFRNLYNPVEEEETHWLYSPTLMGSVAAVVVILFLIVTFLIDTTSPGAIEKGIERAGTEIDLDEFIERQNIISAISNNRPDILDLINIITECGSASALSGSDSDDSRGGRGGMVGMGGRGGGGRGGSIQLDHLRFKKGQPVTIEGRASNRSQVYQFQENLENVSEIRNVTPNLPYSSAAAAGNNRGGEQNGVNFSMTFHYKNFTSTR